VPLRVQQAITKRVPPPFRYIPTRVPTGYEYRKWHGAKNGLDIYFGQKLDLGFHVVKYPPYSAQRCSGAGSARTYPFGSIRVYWGATYVDQDYWRCVRNGSVTISASYAHTGYGPSSRRRQIAAMVASAKPLG
jgi:hypothetical protein